MERTGTWLLALATAAVAGVASYLLLGAGPGITVANAAAYGTLAWLSIAHRDLLHRGRQPRPVAAWAGVAGGFSAFVALVVLTVGAPAIPTGGRIALAALAFGTTWAGVGLGISLADAAARAD